jgi:C-terminal processing protease CtpA/Prc
MKMLSQLLMSICILATPLAKGQEISGIGVALRSEGTDLVVQEVLPDSPAALSKAIHPGDRIVAIAQDGGDPVEVKGMNLVQLAGLIRGPKGTSVRLSILPTGNENSEPKVVKLVRGKLKIVAGPAPGLSLSFWLVGVGLALPPAF